MVSSAGGMVLGGFLARDAERSERIVALAFGVAACLVLAMAMLPVPALLVPVLFGCIGFLSGISGPSRDLLVKQATPEHASGRVYGVVYGGLDIGQALMPLLIGRLMDQQQYRAVWLVLAVMQVLLIATAFQVRRARRAPLAAMGQVI
jgi:MFS family permease